jgi:proton-translocating NADH-quinone oxidoreductase chain L
MTMPIIFIPLIGAILAGFFGRYLGKKGSIFITTFGMLSNAFFTIILFLKMYKNDTVYIVHLGEWINSGLFSVDWEFMFDNLTVSMLFVINTISAIVHIYSSSYMSNDPHLPRFMSYLSLFSFFMLVLVTSDNFIQLFLGWEGVGLCSYLLISFWSTRVQANKAALKALIVNRISDFAFILGSLVLFFIFRSVDFPVVFALASFFSDKKILVLGYLINPLELAATLLIIGAMGKSAQIFLHTWLPDAMEGPTPVSALIHAATMVTAGVFLIIRCSPLLEYTPGSLLLLTLVGGITAFITATISLFQNDIKKVIAYSTCSQLGYMFFSCGLSNYSVSLFHLVNHAFFKAALFLSAGAIIHSLSNEQDMRRMGGLRLILPISYTVMLIATIAIVGFPFLTGFFSKDIIIETAAVTITISGNFVYWLSLVTAMFTAFYSFRLLYLVFYLDTTNLYLGVAKKIHESDATLSFSLLLLAIGSLFIGYLTKDLFIGIGSVFLESCVFILPEHKIGFWFETEILDTWLKLLPFLFTVVSGIGVLVFYYFFKKYILPSFIVGFIKQGLSKWNFDRLYNVFINKKIFLFGYNIFSILDRGFFENIGPNGIIKLIYKVSDFINRFQTGLIYQYVASFVVGIICLSGIYFYIVL